MRARCTYYWNTIRHRQRGRGKMYIILKTNTRPTLIELYTESYNVHSRRPPHSPGSHLRLVVNNTNTLDICIEYILLLRSRGLKNASLFYDIPPGRRTSREICFYSIVAFLLNALENIHENQQHRFCHPGTRLCVFNLFDSFLTTI